MSGTRKRYTGGCLCGALRYEADGEPLFAGHCYCADCRKAFGSGFIPFMGFASSAVRFSGQTRQFTSARPPAALCAPPALPCRPQSDRSPPTEPYPKT
jgi:hypothetical protein